MFMRFPADFWRLLSVGLINSIVRWLETVVVGVVVYRETDSPFLVSVVTMLRLLPMGLFGAFLGAFVERFDRRVMLAAMMALLAATSVVLAAIAALGTLQVWHLAVGALVNGFGWLTDNPLRRTMMGDSVGRERMSTAMALDVVAQNASRMIGPTLGGVVLVAGGVEGAFLLCAGLYLLAVGAALAVRGHRPPVAHAEPVLARPARRHRHRAGQPPARRHPRRHDRLQYFRLAVHQHDPGDRPRPAGARPRRRRPADQHRRRRRVRGRPGAGLAAGAPLPRGELRRRRGALPGGHHRLCVGARRRARPSVALLMTGLAGGAFATLQATLVYLAAPIEMRSRIMGVLSVCIGTGPIGFLWLGWLADRIGAPEATAVTGALGLALLLALRPLWRTI